MSSELETYKQDPLFGEKSMSTNGESIKIGMNAGEVVSKIFDFYRINQFSYTEYDPESTYPMNVDQVLSWDTWAGLNYLEKLSEQVVDTTIQTFYFEGEKINMHNILAIGSKIKIGKDIKQIPMLDFDFSEIETNTDMMKELELPRGVILRTDRSYHYYGLNLIDEPNWEKWIKKLLLSKNTENLFGMEYLKLCLKRGYSALRIFGYEGTSKAIAPVVVAKI
jgi:hypothetical protein